MRYRLKFFDAQERLVREHDIEADDDASAIHFSCEQSIHFAMPVALCREARTVIRLTPMTAQLYLKDEDDGPAC